MSPTSRLTTGAVAMAVAALVSFPGVATAQPANDLCANAILLNVSAGSTASATGTTTAATRDGTASCGSSSTTVDVWYRFVVPAAGNLIVDTCSASTAYDTVLSVHTACPGSGAQIGCNDDDNVNCSNNRSRIVLSGRPAGEQLWVRVSGFNGASGNFGINVTHAVPAPPANDLCASAQTITVPFDSAATITNGNTVLAGNEGSASCQASSGSDVWFRVVAPGAGNLTIDNCTTGTFDSVISAHTDCPGSGTELGCNDNGSSCTGGRSRLTLSGITSGQTVYIRVAGVGTASGTFSMTVRHAQPGVPPNPTLGPDVITNVITDVARWGTDVAGTTTAYSVGTDSCNIGDYPVLWIDNNNYAPDYNVTQHPVISQNLYRLKSYGAYSRFEQLGQSWLKHGFVSTNSGGCGTCGSTSIWRDSLQSYQSVGGDALGLRCSDTYGSGLNGSQSGLGPKNIVDATMGTSPFIRGTGTGDTTTRMRLQVPTSDVTGQPAGTRFFVDALYITADDAQFVGPTQTVGTNALNNASWRELNAGTINNSSPSFATTTQQLQPGIFAWKAADAAVTLVTADHDDCPTPYAAGKFIRSRFWVAAKATSLGGGQYRYEYAVYNHNSDRSAGRFTVPLPSSATLSDVTFHAPQWHSGEPYSNTAWSSARSGQTLVFSTEDFATNANANAVRWGCLYNFGFTTDAAPTTGPGTISLFKPGYGPQSPASIDAAGLPVPSVPCTGATVGGQSGPTGPVCRGGTATFTVTAAGTAPFTYQWRKDTMNIGGANSDTLTISPVGTGDAGSYDVVVTNACGNATSAAATLSVCVADFNCMGGVSVQDVFDFLAAYFASDPSADINGGGLGVQDIFDFLALYFQSC